MEPWEDEKSYHALIKWSWKVTWQTKAVISTLTERQCSPDFVGWGVALKDFYLESNMTISSRDLATSRDKLKPLRFYCRSTYGHHTWLDGDISWGAPKRKLIWHFDHVILQCHVTNEDHYIPTTRMPMSTTRRCKLVTYSSHSHP